MILTENQKMLIKALARNDTKKAKHWAKVCCEEDKTQKNELFVKTYLPLLETHEEETFTIPHEIKNMICVENVSETFIVSRYFLSERERKLCKKISLMSRAAAKLQEMKINYRNSSLLYGESGTGKTTFGRYLAHQFNLPFCYVKFSTLISSLMGDTSKNIEKVFSFISSNPCVFMLDELDAISKNRSDNGQSAGDEMNRVTITIMQNLDRLPNNVILLAATNRLDTIDDAVLRRFSVKHEVKPFNDNEKKQLLYAFLSDVGFDFSESECNEIIAESGNQSGIINCAIEKIAERIIEDIDSGANMESK